jgi:hypothetical protein
MGKAAGFALSRTSQQCSIYQALPGVLRLYSELQAFMASFAPPLSVSITEAQLAWLDQRRLHGALSRSAVLRQVIDAAIAAERAGMAKSGPVLAAAAERR